MKKIIALLLAVLSLVLASCSSGMTYEEEGSLQETTTETSTVKDPKEDGKMRVFFVSNSTCYYFTDELYGMLTAAGYEDVRLCLVYASGCPLERHYNWWKENHAGYQYRVVDKKGITMTPNYTLEQALAMENWDVISFDNNARSFASGDADTAIGIAEPYFGALYKYIQGRFPNARYFWHQVWAMRSAIIWRLK